MHARPLVTTLLLGLLWLFDSRSWADSPTATPWAQGVTTEQKGAAQQLLTKGNELYVQNLYKEAALAYEQALTHWKHPAIAFNLARAYIALDQPLKAHALMPEVLRHGASPYEAEVYAEALNYQRLLASMVATLTIACGDAPTVFLDGEPLACPRTSLTVRPGKHVLTASKPGYVPYAQDLLVPAGDYPEVTIRLRTLASATKTRTRWQPWKPWATVGAGAVVAGAGLALQFSARSVRETYRDALATECAGVACVELSSGTRALDETWQFRDRASIATMALGGIIVLAGSVLVVMNRPYNVVETSPVAVGLTLQHPGLIVAGRF